MDTPRDEFLERLLSRRPWLQGMARALVHEPSLAEDVVQETWVAALIRPPRGPEGPWLAAVVRRATRFWQRSEGRRRTREERAARSEAVSSPAELLERVEIEQRLVQELRALAEPFRTTLLRRYFEGLSAAEIARADGVPQGTVRWRTSRGLAELRRRLAPALGERESLALALAPLLRAAPGGALAGAAWIGGLGMGWKAWSSAAALFLLGIVVARARIARPGELTENAGVTQGGEVVLEQAERAADTARAPARADSPSREPVAVVQAPRVRVLAADGQALAGTAVQWRCAGAGDSVSARLDAAGVLELSAERVGPLELAVERSRGFPHVARLELRPGEQDLVLPEGLELSGTILVDGASPRRPLQLELFPLRRYSASRPMSADLFERDRVQLATDERGGFRFLGLEAGEYELGLPRGHALAGGLELGDPDPRMKLRVRPGTGQLIELERFPSARGRVLLPDGTPARAELNASVTWNGNDGMGIGAATDETGAFELFFERSWRTLYVECEARAVGARGEFAFESSELEDGDLGDLVLEQGPRLELLVHDAAGAPIEGAMTTAGKGLSGPDGRLELRFVSEPFTVAAHGYLPREVQPSGAGELEVRLSAGPGLEVLVLDAGGAPVPEAPLRIEAERELFDGPDGRLEARVWRSDPARVGRHRVSGNRKEGGVYAEFACNGDGRWRTGGVRAGVPFRLRIGARTSTPFHEELVPALGPAERRRLEIRLPLTLATLRGRALDAEGRAVPGARCATSAALFHGHGDRLYCESDASGRIECSFLLPPDLVGPLAVNFERGGFLTRTIPWNPAAEEALEVRLDPGKRVLVSVVDTTGAIVPGGRVVRRPLGAPSWTGTEMLRPGVFEASGFEDGLVEFRLDLAGRQYTRTHSTEAEELVFEIERPARVRVAWQVESAEPWLRWLHVRLLPEEEVGITYRTEGDERTDALSGSAEFRAVVPGAYTAVLYLEEGEELVDLGRRPFEVAEGQRAELEIRARR